MVTMGSHLGQKRLKNRERSQKQREVSNQKQRKVSITAYPAPWKRILYELQVVSTKEQCDIVKNVALNVSINPSVSLQTQ